MSTAAQETKLIEKPIQFGSFLKDQIVHIKPIEAGARWSNLLVKGEEKKKEPFLFDKVKRSFQVPFNSLRKGGGVPQLLDDQKRVHIQKYIHGYPNGMTEREFFEKELGIDLNHTVEPELNFWRTNRKARVLLDKQGAELNMMNPMDVIRYLILKSNTDRIAPSYEERHSKATYEFMIVDEGKYLTKQAVDIKTKTQAASLLNELISSMDKMRNFITSLGRVIPTNATEEWLIREVDQEMQKDYAKFITNLQDSNYLLRVFIQTAVNCGALIRRGSLYFTEHDIEIGDLRNTINYFLDPENENMKTRVKAQIKLSKGY